MSEQNPSETRPRLVLLLLTLGVSVLVIVLVLELFVRIYGATGRIYDLEQWKYGKFLKTDSRNERIGFEHVPGERMRLQGHMVSINRFGFRDIEYSRERPANTVRIVVLGDSMTFGWGAGFEEIFTEVLERDLNAFYKHDPSIEIINMGCGNYNTSMQVALFKEKGLMLSPQIALLNYFINDAEVTPHRSMNPLLNTPFQLPAVLWSRLHKLYTAVHREQDYKDYYLNLYKSDQVGWIRTQKALEEFFSLCREHGIVPLVSIIPELHDLSEGYPFREVHQEVAKVCRASGVTCVDLFPFFKGKVGSDFWAQQGDPHLNAAGHALIAGALDATLKQFIQPFAMQPGGPPPTAH